MREGVITELIYDVHFYVYQNKKHFIFIILCFVYFRLMLEKIFKISSVKYGATKNFPEYNIKYCQIILEG